MLDGCDDHSTYSSSSVEHTTNSDSHDAPYEPMNETSVLNTQENLPESLIANQGEEVLISSSTAVEEPYVSSSYTPELAFMSSPPSPRDTAGFDHDDLHIGWNSDWESGNMVDDSFSFDNPLLWLDSSSSLSSSLDSTSSMVENPLIDGGFEQPSDSVESDHSGSSDHPNPIPDQPSPGDESNGLQNNAINVPNPRGGRRRTPLSSEEEIYIRDRYLRLRADNPNPIPDQPSPSDESNDSQNNFINVRNRRERRRRTPLFREEKIYIRDRYLRLRADHPNMRTTDIAKQIWREMYVWFEYELMDDCVRMIHDIARSSYPTRFYDDRFYETIYHHIHNIRRPH